MISASLEGVLPDSSAVRVAREALRVAGRVRGIKGRAVARIAQAATVSAASAGAATAARRGVDRAFADRLTATVEGDLAAARVVFSVRLAEEVQRALRRSPIWPTRSGRSRQAMTADLLDDGNEAVIEVANSAHLPRRNAATAFYARFVNNRPRYPRGRRNPNYRAAQRTVEGAWSAIVRRADASTET